MELPMKRGREGIEMDRANCLVLLSKIGQTKLVTKNHVKGRTFTCKTCNKTFPSFQALGGHRASHKKLKFSGDDLLFKLPNSPPKPKTHDCPMCGIEFPIGQALGGHMRKHRAAITTTNTNKDNSIATSSATWNSSNVSNEEELATKDIFPDVGLTKKSSCRIFGVDMSVVGSTTLDLFV